MLARLCPCCPIGGEKARLVELTPFPLDGETEPPPPAGIGARFSSALKVAASPLTALRDLKKLRVARCYGLSRKYTTWLAKLLPDCNVQTY